MTNFCFEMNYLAFERAFRTFPVFSVKDIEKRFPDFDNRRLVEWQQKNYLLKVRRGYYCFEESHKGEHFMYFAANKIWKPSYVSLESGLAYYNFIPEGVFITTSITTRNTASYATPVGNFDYKSIKSVLFFGYKLIQEEEFTFKMAEPEKVILDFFYSNKLNSLEEIEAMRFNEVRIKELVDMNKLAQYQKVFKSKVLDKRIRLFKKVINA